MWVKKLPSSFLTNSSREMLYFVTTLVGFESSDEAKIAKSVVVLWRSVSEMYKEHC